MASKKDYAILITSHKKAELIPIAREAKPLEPDELTGHSLATLISTGTELASAYHATEGFPRGLGYSAVFRVEEIGNEINDIKIGDIVFCMGGHRSYQRMRRSFVIPLPKKVEPEIAVFARLMGVSMSTLTTTTARPPEKVLVMGLGIVGNLAAQNFTCCGYDVIACDPDEVRRNIALESGLEKVFTSIPFDDPDINGKIGLVLDCSGHEQAVLDACNVVRKRGEVVLIATPWKRYTDMYAHTILHAVFHKYVVMRSGWEWELPLHFTDFRTNSIFGNIESALKWLAEGRIKVSNLYNKISPEEARFAYQSLSDKNSEKLTYVFDWSKYAD